MDNLATYFSDLNTINICSHDGVSRSLVKKLYEFLEFKGVNVELEKQICWKGTPEDKRDVMLKIKFDCR